MASEPEDLAVEIPPEAQAVAAELVRAVRVATRDLPFHLEPASFLVALEELGADEAP
ncbi:MAG: hypothetical protein U1E45_12430 [Geminicoccaceae bacterium]